MLVMGMSSKKHQIPDIRFKGFTDAWEQRKLGDIADIKDSARISNELWVENGIPYLRSSDLVNGELNGELFISKETYEGYASKTGAPQKDDVLFTSGGKVGVVYHKKDESPVYVQGGAVLYVKTSTSNLLDGSFLSIYFGSPRMQTYMDIASSGGTIKHFTLKPANASPIIFPGLSEQQKIGAFFKELDKTIALHQRKLTLLKQLKQTYLQALFPQSELNIPTLRFARFSDSWEHRKVSSLAKETFGGGTPKTGVKKYWKGSFPWIQSSDLTTNQLHNVQPTKFITEEAIKQSATHNVPGNSIAIVTRVGVGKLALMRSSYSTSQDFLSLSNLNVDAVFGVYCLYKMLQREVNNIQGTSIKGITKADLLGKCVSVPTKVEEQVKIGAFFKKIDDTIDFHESKLKHILELKKAFLEKMFL